jgi:fatty acid desaturase
MSTAVPAKSHHYWKSVDAFKVRLRQAIPTDELRALHRRQAWKHLLYAARQFGIVAVCSVLLWRLENPLLWIPLAVLQGFTFFNMTVLLHEAVHNAIFQKRRDGWTRGLGLAYAITSGISASQFTRWHLDHHDNLGSSEDDPKRHWLSPKRNARWYKLLYCTFVLIPLYFLAAANETATYPAALRRRIKRERIATMVIQLSVMGALFYFGGWGWNSPAVRIQIVPYFFVFPVAFTLNRLGQHYNIDPSHPLKWSTLMKASRLWDFLFVYSNYHLEHHYFPGVPFYNLRKLHLRLLPLYRELGLKPRTYREIVWGWFVRNEAPHTDWDAPKAPPSPPATGRTAPDARATPPTASPQPQEPAARIAVR